MIALGWWLLSLCFVRPAPARFMWSKRCLLLWLLFAYCLLNIGQRQPQAETKPGFLSTGVSVPHGRCRLKRHPSPFHSASH